MDEINFAPKPTTCMADECECGYAFWLIGLTLRWKLWEKFRDRSFQDSAEREKCIWIYNVSAKAPLICLSLSPCDCGRAGPVKPDFGPLWAQRLCDIYDGRAATLAMHKYFHTPTPPGQIITTWIYDKRFPGRISFPSVFIWGLLFVSVVPFAPLHSVRFHDGKAEYFQGHDAGRRAGRIMWTGCH